MRAPDPLKPWTKQSPRDASGSGVVIEGKRILTNAHVVMYASQLFVESHEHLIENDVVDDRRASCFEQRRHQTRALTTPLDDLRDPLRAELPDRRVDRESAGAAGRLWRPVERIALELLAGGEIRSRRRDRGAMRIGMTMICGPRWMPWSTARSDDLGL